MLLVRALCSVDVVGVVLVGGVVRCVCRRCGVFCGSVIVLVLMCIVLVRCCVVVVLYCVCAFLWFVSFCVGVWCLFCVLLSLVCLSACVRL